jgi:hypothetical protein
MSSQMKLHIIIMMHASAAMQDVASVPAGTPSGNMVLAAVCTSCRA